MRLALIGLLMLVVVLQASIVFQDNFSTPGTRLNLAAWTTEIGQSSFLGRTQLADWVTPGGVGQFVVGAGGAQLALNTFNPTGFSLYGTHAKTLQSFQPTVNTPVLLQARLQLTSLQPGLVYGIYFYGCPGPCATQHDEIDIELVTNVLQSGSPLMVQLTRYANEPLGAGNGGLVNLPAGFNPLAPHDWAIRWSLNQIDYFVDGILLGSATDHVPPRPMQAEVIAWGPDAGWPVAYSSSLQPVMSAAQNQRFVALLSSVVVSSGDSAPTALGVNPPSGSAFTQNFNFVFSDLDGFADVAVAEVIFNSVLDASFGCTIAFDRASNSASLFNDTATSKATLTMGAPGTASNGQCAVDVSQAAFVGSGATLAVNNVSITFAQAFYGTKNVYLYAQDASGLNSGLPQLGTWTVPPFVNVAPSALSVSPASGTGAVQTFTLTFSDPNGYTDLASPEIIINSVLDGRNACVVVFNRRGNSLSLVNDGGTSSTTVGLGGTLDITQNSQCVLYASGSSASGAGGTLTLNVALAFKAGFAGAKTVYLVTSDTAGASSGIQTRGMWTVPGAAPQGPSAGTVTPSSGAGQGGIFTYSFTDPNGFADLILPEILFNVVRDGRVACVVLYDRFSNRFFLVNDSSTNSTSVLAGSAETTENGQCLVNGAGSSASGSGNTLTLTLNVTFKQPFTGAKNIYLFAQGVEGLNTGIPQVGTWTVPPYTNQPPVNVSVMPASGSGSGQLFQARFRDPNGYGDLVAPEFLFNSVLEARNSCTVIYDKLNGTALLLNDAATVNTPVLLDSLQTAQNSQCILLGQGSLVIASNTDLVLQLNLLFKPVFAGPKTIYMYTTDGSGSSTPLEAKGTFTVQ